MALQNRLMASWISDNIAPQQPHSAVSGKTSYGKYLTGPPPPISSQVVPNRPAAIQLQPKSFVTQLQPQQTHARPPVLQQRHLLQQRQQLQQQQQQQLQQQQQQRLQLTQQQRQHQLIKQQQLNANVRPPIRTAAPQSSKFTVNQQFPAQLAQARHGNSGVGIHPAQQPQSSTMSSQKVLPSSRPQFELQQEHLPRQTARPEALVAPALTDSRTIGKLQSKPALLSPRPTFPQSSSPRPNGIQQRFVVKSSPAGNPLPARIVVRPNVRPVSGLPQSPLRSIAQPHPSNVLSPSTSSRPILPQSKLPLFPHSASNQIRSLQPSFNQVRPPMHPYAPHLMSRQVSQHSSVQFRPLPPSPIRPLVMGPPQSLFRSSGVANRGIRPILPQVVRPGLAGQKRKAVQTLPSTAKRPAASNGQPTPQAGSEDKDVKANSNEERKLSEDAPNAGTESAPMEEIATEDAPMVDDDSVGNRGLQEGLQSDQSTLPEEPLQSEGDILSEEASMKDEDQSASNQDQSALAEDQPTSNEDQSIEAEQHDEGPDVSIEADQSSSIGDDQHTSSETDQNASSGTDQRASSKTGQRASSEADQNALSEVGQNASTEADQTVSEANPNALNNEASNEARHAANDAEPSTLTEQGVGLPLTGDVSQPGQDSLSEAPDAD